MCKKGGLSCEDHCKCASEKCANRKPELPESTTNDAELESSQENVSYLLRLGIQHLFKLHITLLTKFIVDVVSH